MDSSRASFTSCKQSTDVEGSPRVEQGGIRASRGKLDDPRLLVAGVRRQPALDDWMDNGERVRVELTVKLGRRWGIFETWRLDRGARYVHPLIFDCPSSVRRRQGLGRTNVQDSSLLFPSGGRETRTREGGIETRRIFACGDQSRSQCDTPPRAACTVRETCTKARELELSRSEESTHSRLISAESRILLLTRLQHDLTRTLCTSIRT